VERKYTFQKEINLGLPFFLMEGKANPNEHCLYWRCTDRTKETTG
jgi:hypothetical protein